MEEEEDKTDRANEPHVNYGSSNKGRFAFFNSFEEAAEADREFYRNLTPEQRLRIHYELSIRVYGIPKTNPNSRFTF